MSCWDLQGGFGLIWLKINLDRAKSPCLFSPVANCMDFYWYHSVPDRNGYSVWYHLGWKRWNFHLIHDFSPCPQREIMDEHRNCPLQQQSSFCNPTKVVVWLSLWKMMLLIKHEHWLQVTPGSIPGLHTCYHSAVTAGYRQSNGNPTLCLYRGYSLVEIEFMSMNRGWKF